MACACAISASTGAQAATQSGTGKAIALRPLSIVKLRDLEFGRLVSGTTAGTVVIDPTTDIRTTTGGVLAAGGAPMAAQFYTYATGNQTLQVTRGPLLPVLAVVLVAGLGYGVYAALGTAPGRDSSTRRRIARMRAISSVCENGLAM